MSQQLAECTSQLARYDFLLVFDRDIRRLGGHKASNSAETRQIKQLENKWAVFRRRLDAANKRLVNQPINLGTSNTNNNNNHHRFTAIIQINMR